jgi:hypothetical protein
LMKYFHGDKKKVASAMELIHTEASADNDEDANDDGQDGDDEKA